MKDDDLTPSEKKAMETLPKERMPQASLEGRVVDALNREGMLRAAKGRTIELTGMRVAAAIAACIALLVGGFMMGTLAGVRPAKRAAGPAFTEGEVPVAASLQRAGTAYVSFLEDLAEMNASRRGDDMRQGREVALKTLYTAADQMKRIIPSDVLSACITQAMAETGDGGAGTDEKPIIRF